MNIKGNLIDTEFGQQVNYKLVTVEEEYNCIAPHTAAPADHSEKDNMWRTENGLFKHHEDISELQRTIQAESPLRAYITMI